MLKDKKLQKEITSILIRALREDIGSGDVTTNALVSDTLQIKAQIVAKSKGIIAGLEICGQVFKLLDSDTIFTPLVADGAQITSRTVVAMVEGRAQVILSGERVALNVAQRMSAVATKTQEYVLRVKGTKAVILDTRKTMPGLRVLDKLAVVLGGGRNHRFGLFDMILVKDNHIALTKNITSAVASVRLSKPSMPVEVEVRNLDELKEALMAKPDRILLDNMTLSQIKNAVTIVHGSIPLEVSGGVNLSTVSQIAKTGVDYISVGALTHSAAAMDLSLECI